VWGGEGERKEGKGRMGKRGSGERVREGEGERDGFEHAVCGGMELSISNACETRPKKISKLPHHSAVAFAPDRHRQSLRCG